jgi:signal transduction histidine kinase
MKYIILLIFLFSRLLIGAQNISVYYGDKIEAGEVIHDKMNFRKSDTRNVNFGLSKTSKFIWVTDLTNSQVLISVDNPTIDTVNFYSTYKGELRKLKMEDLGYSKVVENNLGNDSILIEAKSTTQLVIPVSFNFKSNITSSTNEIENFFFFFIGIMFSVLLYNLFIFLSTRDFIYLRYVIFICFIGMTQLVLYGQVSKSFFGLFPSQIHWIQIVGALSGIVTIIFSRSFLKLKVYAMWIYHITNLSLLSYFSVFLFLIIGMPVVAYQMINVNASFSILLLVGAYISFRKGYRPALYFLVAFSTFLAGVTIFALKDFGLIEYNLISKYSLPVGVIIESILLSLALADRINILKREKEASQAQAILMMEENQRLIHQQNNMLENEVQTRTSELQESNANLEKTVHNLQLTQKQLVESEKLASLGQMTAGIAHEINNPVNFVRSNVQPLKRDVDELLEVINELNENVTPDQLPQKWQKMLDKYKELDIDYLQQEIHQLLQGIDEGSKRTAEIVRSLRVFSRMDRDVLVMADINECIQSTLMVMKNVTSKESTVITELDEKLPNVLCFPGKLNQVLMNLISNAVHATKMDNRLAADRKVWVKTKSAGDNIQIVIQDNGSGMKEEVRKKLEHGLDVRARLLQQLVRR